MMTEQNEANVEKANEAGLMGQAAEATGKGARLALNVLSMPLLILPRNSRRHARRAMGEFTMAFMVLPREFAQSSERLVDRLAGEDPGDTGIPSTDEITERARAFADRMMRTAEDITAGVTSTSQRIGDAAEDTASKVDNWVQSKS